MDNILACAPGSWLPFKDPDVEEELRMASLILNVNAEIERKTIHMPSQWERSDPNLRRILRANGHEVQRSLLFWKEWIMWRKSLELDEITEEDIKFETASGIAFWKGTDKSGRPTLVLTGRMLDPISRKGTLRSFKKFMIRTVEEGCRLADAAGQQSICIIYDRRGLEYKHIDPVLHQLTRMTADSLRTYYGPRLGIIYVIHANLFFWGVYLALIRPFLAIISSTAGDRVKLLNDRKDLLPYFEESEIHMLGMDITNEIYEANLVPTSTSTGIISNPGPEQNSVKIENNNNMGENSTDRTYATEIIQPVEQIDR